MRPSLLLIGAGLLLLGLSWFPRPAPAAPLAPVAVITPTLDPTVFGRSLFVAKGCASCHNHRAITGQVFFGDFEAPDLSDYPANPEFLRSWLKDPQAVRPGTTMPDLGLKEVEIKALIGFLGVAEAE